MLIDSWIDDLHDGSTVTFQPYKSTCRVEVRGSVDFVADIGDQLGWLASTLRESPVEDGLLSCFPKVKRFQATVNAIIVTCELDFELATSQDIILGSPGFCWARLFRNPLLVTNYPVRPRDMPNTGLEISLDLMAEVIRSRQLTSIGGRIMLKGFCSLLVATAEAGDAVLWHYIYNSTSERISYNDPRLESIHNGMPEGIALEGLEARRHIVGWCSDIREYSGGSFHLPS